MSVLMVGSLLYSSRGKHSSLLQAFPHLLLLFLRYSDFIVHELSQKGDVVQLTKFSLPIESNKVSALYKISNEGRSPMRVVISNEGGKQNQPTYPMIYHNSIP